MADKSKEKDTDESEDTGIRTRKSFMLKQFVPEPDWINVNVVAKGKGTKAILGRVWGVCVGWEAKSNTLPDGRVSASTVLKGIFNSESYLTGELSQASSIYLPAAYADKVKAIFASDEAIKVVELDVDIGLEATGKTIPYEWVVIAFREGKEMQVLQRIASSRKRPANAPKMLPKPKD